MQTEERIRVHYHSTVKSIERLKKNEDLTIFERSHRDVVIPKLEARRDALAWVLDIDENKENTATTNSDVLITRLGSTELKQLKDSLSIHIDE